MDLIKDTVIVGKDLNIEMGKCARSDRTESSFSVAMDAASIVSQFLYSCRLNVLRISRLNFFCLYAFVGQKYFCSTVQYSYICTRKIRPANLNALRFDLTE